MAKDGMVAGERGKERKKEGGRGREGGKKAHSCSLSYINLKLFSLAGD